GASSYSRIRRRRSNRCDLGNRRDLGQRAQLLTAADMAGTSLSSNVGHDFCTVGLTSIFPVETTVRRSLVGRLCPDRSAQVPRPTDAHRNQRSPSADTLWHTNSGCRQRRRNGPRWVRPQVINTLVRSYNRISSNK